jgi:DNA helicase IV
LKNLRDDFIANRKRKRGLTTTNVHEFSSVSINNINSKDENYLRRLLDKEKYTTKNKKSMLFNLQDKLKEVEENKLGYIEENPLMRNVRVLENRLDKVMIKYNEAQSVQKTYEEVLKRLREERVGYDSQLAII